MKDNFWIVAAWIGLAISTLFVCLSINLYHDRNSWRLLAEETCTVLLKVTEPKTQINTVWMQPMYFPVVYERRDVRDSVLMRMCEEVRKDAALYRAKKEVKHD